MSKPSLKAQQLQLRRNVIIETALALLVANGYLETSMDQIAAEAGISKATLYQDFPSKDELTINAILLGIHRSEEVLAVGSQDLSAIARLELVLRVAIERRIGVLDTRIRNLPASVTNDPRLREPFQRMAEFVTSLIDEAKAAGDVEPTIPTQIITHMLGGVFQIDYEHLLVQYDLTASDLSDTLISMLFEGIRTSEN